MQAWLSDFLVHSSSFMPHGACYHWLPSVLWLHVISDTVITVANYSIPIALWYFVPKRTALRYRWVFVLLGIFILLCGTTHLMSIWTIWHPDHWAAGLLKLATALVSIITVFLIWPLIPSLLKFPSPVVLESRENYMRAIFDSTPDAMLISDNQGIITMANKEAENLLGFTVNELIGQSIEKLVPERFREAHPGLRQGFAASPYNRAMGAGRKVLALKKDGEEFDASISLSPIQTEKGLFFASALRDVTQEKLAENALRASEERFRRMANASPAMIWITDSVGNSIFVNQTWLNFTGIEYTQALQRDQWIDLIHPDDRNAVTQAYYRTQENHGPIVTEYRMRHKSGEWRWILDQGIPLNDLHGEFSGYIGSAIDITERKLAETEFRIAAAAFESQEAMVITDTNTLILRVNKTFCDSTGYAPEEVVGQKMNILKSGAHDQKFFTEMWHSINTTGTWQGEIWDKRKNGEVYPKWLTVTAVKDATGAVTHYVGTHIDISDRKAAEEEIKHLAFYDPLTKLPNRRLLRDRLQQALLGNSRSNMYGALLFIDLDNFKALNDTLGHDVGDLLLQDVAARLTSCVRECDTVARLGGDEFIVMLENLSEHTAEAARQAEGVGEKILFALNQPYFLTGKEHHSSPSIGISLFDDKKDTVDLILKQADIAMYQAKSMGRNTLRFFNASMQAAVSARVSMESDLHKASLEKQFILYYQPQVNQLGQLTGVEALLRWNHPQHGLVSPIDFIPLAEETGLILSIGQWVMETACEQLASWAKQPEMASLSISVNVSVRQFHHPNFVNQVLSAIALHETNPKNLKLELTESLLSKDIEGMTRKMTLLKEVGVSFSLDDFGTGYSSLYYLKHLPLTQLKIDQSFVRDILVDANDATIAIMIISLSQSMGLEVIAEGVENEEQRRFLAEHGCENYQGNLSGRPMPSEAIEAMFNMATRS